MSTSREDMGSGLAPGPYEIIRFTSPAGQGFRVVDINKQTVCLIPPRPDLRGDAQTIAQAMAVTPELLAAATRVIEVYLNLAAPTTVIRDHFHVPVSNLADAVAQARSES